MPVRLVIAVLLAGGSWSVTETQLYTFALPAGRSLSLAITVGDVRIRGEARGDAVVEVTRTAPTREALTRIPVRVDETVDAVRIAALQADAATDPALRTDVTLRVPQQAALPSIRVLEGRVTITGLSGRVDADVRRGPIDAVDLQGIVRLETGIGDITATGLRLTPGGLLRLRAFNGHVRLVLAEPPRDARILALVLNGAITSDIPLTTRDNWGPRWGEATLGAGETVLSIDVITGSITIRTLAGRQRGAR